jgi:hypothetical protein
MVTRTETRDLEPVLAATRGAELLGRGRWVRRTYSLDDIALVPAASTLDPEDVDTSWQIGPHPFALPFVASAMDSVVEARREIESAAHSKLTEFLACSVRGGSVT